MKPGDIKVGKFYLIKADRDALPMIKYSHNGKWVAKCLCNDGNLLFGFIGDKDKIRGHRGHKGSSNGECIEKEYMDKCWWILGEDVVREVSSKEAKDFIKNRWLYEI
jgi:hypothetical protein